MEKLKVTHDHSLTDILKVLIFTLVLLIPGFMFLPSMLYFGMNEQANAPTTEITIEENVMAETNKVNTYHDLVVGNAYEFDLSNGYTLSANLTYEVEEFYLISGTYQNTQALPSLTSVPYIRFYTDNRVALVSTHIPNSNTDEFIYYTNAKIAFICSNTSDIGNLVNYIKPYDNYNLGLQTYTIQAVDITNQLQYNWDTIWKTPLLNWTNTSILKNGLDNFTQVFGITNTSHINNLIAYELIMVGVYIVIDIVLALFKWLTHMIGNK